MSKKSHKKPKETLKFVYRHKIILELMAKEISENETIVKVISDEPYSHLSFVRKSDGVQIHITDELQTEWRRHKEKRKVTREQILRLLLVLLSQPGNPPPRIRSFENRDEMATIEAWVRRVSPRVFHQPGDRGVMVFREGPFKDLTNSAFSSRFDQTIEWDELIDSHQGVDELDEDKIFETVREDEMWGRQCRLGFVRNPHRLVISLNPTLVAEFNLGALTKSEGMMKRMLNLNQFFEDLEERGILPINIDGEM